MLQQAIIHTVEMAGKTESVSKEKKDVKEKQMEV
jgi:hypothetical protein